MAFKYEEREGAAEFACMSFHSQFHFIIYLYVLYCTLIGAVRTRRGEVANMTIMNERLNKNEGPCEGSKAPGANERQF